MSVCADKDVLSLPFFFFVAKWQGDVRGTYIPGADKVLLTDGSAVGVRSDYNGVLLLDTVLQPPVQKSDDIVRLELLHTEVWHPNYLVAPFIPLALGRYICSLFGKRITLANIFKIPGCTAPTMS